MFILQKEILVQHPYRFGAQTGRVMQQAMSVQEWVAHQHSLDAPSRAQPQRRHVVPRAYENFVQLDFGSIRQADPSACWRDYCPVYALAFLTADTINFASPIEAAEQKRELWERVRGRSSLPWRDVREILVAAWRQLGRTGAH